VEPCNRGTEVSAIGVGMTPRLTAHSGLPKMKDNQNIGPGVMNAISPNQLRQCYQSVTDLDLIDLDLGMHLSCCVSLLPLWKYYT